MSISQSPLPEGTDSILPGAMSDEESTNDTGFGAASPSDAGKAASAAAAKLGDAAAKVGDATAGLRAQAYDKARDYASQGKERTIDALDNVTKLVDEAASTIDEKVGEQYGAYARRASEAVAGFADTLREKDVDELLTDAREAVRKSPAIAIGAAAAIGFVIARLLKAGTPDEADKSTDTKPGASQRPTPSTATTVPVDSSL